jgi:tripartite-type tricarboxylate transporter receptor subunit TctC
MRRAFLTAAVLLAARAALASPLKQTQSTEMPQGPVRFIVPWGPGDGLDRVTRLVARLYSDAVGTPAIVENRPGADTLIAVQALLAAPADGGTILLMSPSSLVVNPLLRKDLPYDAKRDLRPLVSAYRTPMLILTSATSPFRTFGDLVEAARARPGQIALGHYAPSYRLAALLLAQDAGAKFLEVPYKTASQAANDAMGGTLPALTSGLTLAIQLARAGRVRPLAITSHGRNAALPDVPTVAESGFPNFHYYTWAGYGVHGASPEPVVERTEEALLKVVRHPDFTRFMADESGNEVTAYGMARFAREIAEETERFRSVIEKIS